MKLHGMRTGYFAQYWLVVTLPLWLLGVSSMIFSSGDSYQTIQSNPIRLSVLHKVVLLPIIFIISMDNIRRYHQRGKRVTVPMFIYGMYIALAGISTLYTSNLGYSMFKFLEISTAFIAVYGLALRIGAERTLRCVLSVMLSLLVLVWIGVIVSPAEALALGRFKYWVFSVCLNGYLIGMDSNTVGMTAAILLLSTPFLLRRVSKPVKYSWYFIVLATVFLTQSRTALGAILFGGVFLLPSKYMYRYILLLFLLAVCLCVFTPFGDTLLFHVTKGKGIESESTMTLSGRTSVWLYGWEQVKSDGLLLTGYGYGAGTRELMARYGVDEASTMLNAFVNAFVTLGIPGFILLLSTYSSCLVTYLKNRKHSYYPCLIGVVIALGVRSMTGATFSGGVIIPALFTALTIYGDQSSCLDNRVL